MDPSFIQQAIFKAVDVILEKRFKELKLNYCIEGIVDSDPEYDDKGDLYFWVMYQDIRIKAYPISAIHQKDNSLSLFDNDANIDLYENPIYQRGDLVYTLVINGNLNKRRLILSKV